MRTLLRVWAAIPIALLVTMTCLEWTWSPHGGTDPTCTAWSMLHSLSGEFLFLAALIALMAVIGYSFNGSIAPWVVSIPSALLMLGAGLYSYELNPACIPPHGQILLAAWKLALLGLVFLHISLRVLLTAQKSLQKQP